MNRAAELVRLEDEVRACRICVENPQGKPLPHEPRPVTRVSATAKILIAGQAPGTKVHASGIPFDDRSGDRLREWLGMSRAEFYDRDMLAVLPMGFCFPGQDAKGGDLAPRRECAPAWRTKFLTAMPQVELVVAIGLYAQAWHLGDLRSASLTETVADWRRVYDKTHDPHILAMPHPSWRNTGWLKKNLWFEQNLLPFLRAEVDRLLRRG
ncbi:MAG: uracil-DNA glycosylase family protein [Rhizobiaceae bacterium]